MIIGFDFILAPYFKCEINVVNRICIYVCSQIVSMVTANRRSALPPTTTNIDLQQLSFPLIYNLCK